MLAGHQDLTAIQQSFVAQSLQIILKENRTNCNFIFRLAFFNLITIFTIVINISTSNYFLQKSYLK